MNDIKRVCNFYVSSVHLITMILPYINKQLDLGIGFSTFLEYNLKENVDVTLSKLIAEDKCKENILNLNWLSTNVYKYAEIEKQLKDKLNNSKELNIFIMGDNKYINVANENIAKFLDKNQKKLKGKYITIINAYEVTQFNDNIREILDNHESILNTSGVHDISDVFDGYQKKMAN